MAESHEDISVGSTVRRISQSIVTWLLVLILAGPVVFALAGWVGLVLGLIFGISLSFIIARILGWGRSILPSLILGLVYGLLVALPIGYDGLAINVRPEFAVSIPYSFLFGSALGATVSTITGNPRKFVGHGVRWCIPFAPFVCFSAGFLWCVVWALTFACGVWCGGKLGIHLRPGITVFREVSLYLQAMVIPIIGFTLGYVLIVTVFAGFFKLTYVLDPVNSFRIPPDAGKSFGDFLFFAMMTMTTLGYSKIEPQSSATQILVSLEAVVGTGWMVVVFAAIVAYVEPHFEIIDRLRRRINLGRSSTNQDSGEVRASRGSRSKRLTFQYCDFSEYACGLADSTP